MADMVQMLIPKYSQHIQTCNIFMLLIAIVIENLQEQKINKA